MFDDGEHNTMTFSVVFLVIILTPAHTYMITKENVDGKLLLLDQAFVNSEPLISSIDENLCVEKMKCEDAPVRFGDGTS
ncbi:hypothetical protein MAR_030637 [Mya arenaria]|uniref:Transmembrane protein n=1 Tax=Mya arenaria TaxID=6604 RepID=A0ABY7F5S4_MYAAR|nr:hypothetical protein MAR_030637 [Mya arenaria]